MIIGRYIFRELFVEWVQKHKIMRAIDIALHKKGIKIILLLRMTPIMPFSILNYAIGVTSVRVSDFFIGGVGCIPEMVIILYFGTAISNIKKAAQGEFDQGTVFIIMMIVGTIIGIIAIFYISYLAKQELSRTVDEENSNFDINSEKQLNHSHIIFNDDESK